MLLSVSLVFYPFAILCALFWRSFGLNAVKNLFVVCQVAGLFLSLNALYHFDGIAEYFEIYKWLEFGSLSASLGSYVDRLSLTFVAVLNLGAVVALLYAKDYTKNHRAFKDEPALQVRFLIFLCFLTFSTQVFVVAGNFFQMALGWLGISICSFLLLSFFTKKVQIVGRAFRTYILFHIADILLLFALFSLISFGFLQNEPTLDQHIYFDGFVYLKASEIGFSVLLCLIIAAAIRTGQFIFNSWLVEADQVPTPALIMLFSMATVPSGAFLLLRFMPLLEGHDFALDAIKYLGLLTILGSSLFALREKDIKKIFAYIVSAGMGVFFVAIASTGHELAFAYLILVMLASSLLFLISGAVTDANKHDQNIMNYGGLSHKLRFTTKTAYFTAMMMTLVLPLLQFQFVLSDIGRYSDAPINAVFGILFLIGILFLALSFWRVLNLSFWGFCRGKIEICQDLGEKNRATILPSIIMIVSIVWIFLLDFTKSGLALTLVQTSPSYSILSVTSLMTLGSFVFCYFLYNLGLRARGAEPGKKTNISGSDPSRSIGGFIEHVLSTSVVEFIQRAYKAIEITFFAEYIAKRSHLFLANLAQIVRNLHRGSIYSSFSWMFVCVLLIVTWISIQVGAQ